jgi:hypothetical protein
MTSTFAYTETIPVRDGWDLVVDGAALAAARQGLSVLLIETGSPEEFG